MSTTPTPRLIVSRLGDNWHLNPEPPLPAVTHVISGWPDVAYYRAHYNAVDWFPATETYSAFVQEFGPAPV